MLVGIHKQRKVAFVHEHPRMEVKNIKLKCVI